MEDYENIMVVDDEKNFLKLAKVAFRDEGFKVTTAQSGEECLKKLKKEDPDLILLDLMMPGMDGWETYERIQAEKPGTKVIFLSMLDKSPNLNATGVLGHVLKGDKYEMVERVKEIIERS